MSSVSFGAPPGLLTVTTPADSVATDWVEAPYPSAWTAVCCLFSTRPKTMIAPITRTATPPMISWVRLEPPDDFRAAATDSRPAGRRAGVFDEVFGAGLLFWADRAPPLAAPVRFAFALPD